MISIDSFLEKLYIDAMDNLDLSRIDIIKYYADSRFRKGYTAEGLKYHRLVQGFYAYVDGLNAGAGIKPIKSIQYGKYR